MKSWGSQRDRILRLLQSRAGEWVPLYEITPLAAQYNTRIKELRERGHIIDYLFAWLERRFVTRGRRAA